MTNELKPSISLSVIFKKYFKKILISPSVAYVEQWRCWRRRLVIPGAIRPKRRRTHTTHLWSYVYDHLTALFIIRRELLIFFGETSCVLLQGHKLLRLGARYWLGALNGWDTTGRLQVLGHCVNDFVHPISIGYTRRSCLHPQIWIEIQMGRMIIPISLPQPVIKCLLKIKKEIIKFNSRK